MIVVIIAGGSGTRLWPLSTPEYPKHLLKVNGDKNSMLQNTYERAKKLSKHIYVVTEASHAHHIKAQLADLPEENFIIEPGRRGTAHCIAAALSHLEGRHDPDEPIASIGADHYIRDTQGFVHSFKLAAKVAKSQKNIVLVGVEPSYPATGFGYIEKGSLLDEQAYVFKVNSFKEKPDFATANKYLKSGNYLWNCNYFIATLNAFKNIMKADSPQLFANYQKLLAATPSDYDKVYLSFEEIAIDYALIEKTKHLSVVPASFDWMDLGSFKDMYEVVSCDEQGNHILGQVETEELENAFIQNLEDKPVAVIGVDNVVVVNTPHGLLVARKDLSQKVGDVSKRFKRRLT